MRCGALLAMTLVTCALILYAAKNSQGLLPWLLPRVLLQCKQRSEPLSDGGHVHEYKLRINEIKHNISQNIFSLFSSAVGTLPATMLFQLFSV